MVYLSIFSLILTFGYFFLQFLHSINFWENIGVSPAPDHVEPFSTIGMAFFTLFLVLGWSFIPTVLIWRIIGQITSPSQSIIRLILEIIQSWIAISIFETIALLNYMVFLRYISGSGFNFFINTQDIFEIAWINLIIVCVFYTFIGLQAYRKNLGITRFISKVAYDIIQITFLSLEGSLVLLPYGLFEFLIDMSNYPILILSALIYGYNVFLLAFIGETMTWIEEKVKKEEEISQRKITVNIVFFNTSMVLVPLMLFPTLFVVPFYIPFQFSISWITLIIWMLVISIPVSALYHFIKIITIVISKDGLSRFKIMKYKFEMFLSERGTMFEYPTPIDIFIGGELTEKIEYRWEKVAIKMACGQCFHVFSSETLKKGSNIKPIPCAFCGSLATTPVWE